jgi:hypothetical protein
MSPDARRRYFRKAMKRAEKELGLKLRTVKAGERSPALASR